MRTPMCEETEGTCAGIPRDVPQINQCADGAAATMSTSRRRLSGLSCWTGRRRMVVTPDGCLACSQPHPLETLAGTGVDSSTAAAAAGAGGSCRRQKNVCVREGATVSSWRSRPLLRHFRFVRVRVRLSRALTWLLQMLTYSAMGGGPRAEQRMRMVPGGRHRSRPSSLRLMRCSHRRPGVGDWSSFLLSPTSTLCKPELFYSPSYFPAQHNLHRIPADLASCLACLCAHTHKHLSYR